MNTRYTNLQVSRSSATIQTFSATDTLLKREVCIKRYITPLAFSAKNGNSEGLLLFTEKICAAKHPSLPVIYDSGVDEHGPYFVMEHSNGTPFVDMIHKEGPLSEYHTYLLAKDLLDILQTLHYHGFIHGTFQLTSVVAKKKMCGNPKFDLLDFGVHSFTQIVQKQQYSSQHLTHKFLKAPEISDGNPPSESSDLFALGNLLYIALSGGHPFSGMSPEEAVQAQKDNRMKPLSRYADLSEPFERWIHNLIHPSERPATSKEAYQLFKELIIQQPKSTPTPPPIPIETGRSHYYYNA